MCARVPRLLSTTFPVRFHIFVVKRKLCTNLLQSKRLVDKGKPIISNIVGTISSEHVNSCLYVVVSYGSKF
jgi:hypothetical protein